MNNAQQSIQVLVPIAYVVSIIATLAGAIVVLFWVLQRQNVKNTTDTKVMLESWRIESAGNAARMTQVVSESTSAMNVLSKNIESNTKSTDRIFEYLTKATK